MSHKQSHIIGKYRGVRGARSYFPFFIYYLDACFGTLFLRAETRSPLYYFRDDSEGITPVRPL